MREFICVVCGEKDFDYSKKHNKKFCSKRCSVVYYNRKRKGGYKGYQACKFNEGVSCIDAKCDNCGWNPEVAKKRSEAFL